MNLIKKVSTKLNSLAFNLMQCLQFLALKFGLNISRIIATSTINIIAPALYSLP